METKRLIGKPLQPARPARHLSSQTSVPLVSATAFSFQGQFSSNTPISLCNEIGWMCKSNGMRVLNETLVRPSEQHKPEVPKVPAFTQGHAAYSKSKQQRKYGRSRSIQLLQVLVYFERITYSRDFLLKLSEVSLAQKKPEFLPDHPVVLEKPKNYLLPTAGDDRSV